MAGTIAAGSGSRRAMRRLTRCINGGERKRRWLSHGPGSFAGDGGVRAGPSMQRSSRSRNGGHRSPAEAPGKAGVRRVDSRAEPGPHPRPPRPSTRLSRRAPRRGSHAPPLDAALTPRPSSGSHAPPSTRLSRPALDAALTPRTSPRFSRPGRPRTTRNRPDREERSERAASKVHLFPIGKSIDPGAQAGGRAPYMRRSCSVSWRRRGRSFSLESARRMVA
jgi:hypothetical protein